MEYKLAKDRMVSRRKIKQKNITSTIHYHEEYEQLSLFSDNEIKKEKEVLRKKEIEREKKLQETVINIKNKFGKNSILKGMNYQEGATTKERNKQIGGHKA